MVETSLDFSVSVGQSPQFGISESGLALIDLMSPNETGIHPITLSLENLPIGAIDRTDQSHIVSWLVVDSNKPRLVELVSPDSSQIIQNVTGRTLGLSL